MTVKWKWALGVFGMLLLAVVASAVFIEHRGGHYPIYKTSSFSHLTPPSAGTPLPANRWCRSMPERCEARTSDPQSRFEVFLTLGRQWASCAGSRLNHRCPGRAYERRYSQEAPARSEPRALCLFLLRWRKRMAQDFEQPPIKSSEDCLYLDVWVPEWPVKRALPVMVWLHGGSNTVGSGTQSTYDGVSLTRHGVLLVTLNYRLGVMGFFSHPELTAESPHHSSGNYGLLDQLAALNWVKQNIAQFGG